jgi:hypothetical protein
MSTRWPSLSDEFDEPSAVAAGLDPDDHFASQGGVEAADFIHLMVQLGELDLTISRVAVGDGLLTGVEVHTTIDSHGHLLRGLMRKLSLPQLERSSWRCLLHHITTGSSTATTHSHASENRYRYVQKRKDGLGKVEICRGHEMHFNFASLLPEPSTVFA